MRALELDQLSLGGLPRPRRSIGRDAEALAALVYTSGTSARPKGVMLSAGNLESNVRQCVEWAGFSRSDTMLGVLPQFHSFGLTVLTLLPLATGCRVIYTARFMPARLLELFAAHRPTAFIGIPSMFNALLSAKTASRDHFSSLRYLVSGSEPLARSVQEGFRERFGVLINEGYGLTETAPVTNWCRPQEHRPGSVGPPLPGVEECIKGESGEILPPDTDGEVCIRGANVMRGYYKQPEATAAVFDEEGYLRTGDMGRFDEAGHLYITGRIKEMLIIAGENVFPREIEEVLNAYPTVHASAVIGLPDATRGEVPLAFVELEEGAEFDERALRSYCREHLAQFMVPRHIHRLDALPRNPTGKIQRRRLTPELAGLTPER